LLVHERAKASQQDWSMEHLNNVIYKLRQALCQLAATLMQKHAVLTFSENDCYSIFHVF